MIDTFELYGPIRQVHLEHLVEGMGIEHNKLRQVTTSLHEHITLTVKMSDTPLFDHYVYVFVNVPRTLNRGTVSEADRTTVESKITELLAFYLGDPNLFSVMKLKRFDYRLDLRVESEEHRLLYLKLLDRAKPSLRRMKKHGVVDQTGKCQSIYEHSIVHKADSVETIVYDKTEERKAKKQGFANWEESVLRFEVKLKKPHLQTMKYSKRQLQPTLDNYWTVEQYKRYLTDYLLKIYFSGDYYTLDQAKKAICNSTLTKNSQEKLIRILRQVSNGNVETPLNSMSDTTYRKHQKLLGCIGVNLCTIRQAEKSTADFLPNLLEGVIRNL